MSVYEELGRERGIRAAVDDFYQRVVGDEHLAPYFDGVDMAGLRAHQAQLLIQVTGGPAAYAGRDLAAAHSGLGIANQHFDRVVDHLVATLTSMGAGEQTIGAVGAALTQHRDAIINVPATAG